MYRDSGRVRKNAALTKIERYPISFTNEVGNGRVFDGWFYPGRGAFYFYSTYDDSPVRCIRVPTAKLKKAIKALAENGLLDKI